MFGVSPSSFARVVLAAGIGAYVSFGVAGAAGLESAAATAPPEWVPQVAVSWLGAVGGAAVQSAAVHWNGDAPAWIEVFEDRDGDGLRGIHEPAVLEREVEPGLVVVPVTGVTGSGVLALRWRGDGREGVVLKREAATGPAGACGWSPVAGPAGMGTSDWVHDFAVWNDGTGEALYVAGRFSTAGGVTVNGVARWDGSVWSPLGSGAGIGGNVYALAVWEGALFAGGGFASAGGVGANNIAKWDGSSWSPLVGSEGTGTDGAVEALAVWDDGSGPALYVGGSFENAGEIGVNRIAKWDGSVWSPLVGPSGTGVDDTVYTLAVWDDGGGPALYAGGEFETAGGVISNRIARYDGSWSPLHGPTASGVDGPVYALAVWDDGGGSALYAGGGFVQAGGEAGVNHIARWNGSQWSRLDTPAAGWSGTSDWIYSLAVWNDGTGSALYAGGFFSLAAGATVNRVAKWDGTEWSALAGAAGFGTDGLVLALIGWQSGRGGLFAGGVFSTAGGVSVSFLGRFSCSAIFDDGFESGDAAAWSAVGP